MRILSDRLAPEAHEALAEAAGLDTLWTLFQEYGRPPFLKDLQYSDQRRFVFSGGDPASGIMFICEEPGSYGDVEGVPLMGHEGQLFDRMLASIGRNRNTVYLAPVSPWHTGLGKRLTQEDLDVCLPFMKRHIELVAPVFLVCLGGNVARAILGLEGSAFDLRGKWGVYGEEDEIITFVTLHPGTLMKEAMQKELAWRDFQDLGQMINHERPLYSDISAIMED